jgi:hypothetical protein
MCSHSNTEIHGKRLVNDGHVSIWPWRRYDLKVALRFLRILEWLPLAAVVSAQLCCLGGIRPLGGLNLKEIQKLGDQNCSCHVSGCFSGLMDIMGIMVILPSGYVKIAIENGHRNSDFSH